MSSTLLDSEEIENSVITEVNRIKKSYIKKLTSKILGIELDTWGDVRGDITESPLYKQLLQNEEFNSKSSKHIKTLCEGVLKELEGFPFTKTAIKTMARSIRTRIISDAEEQIYSEVYDAFYDIYKKEVFSELESNKTMREFGVIARLREANPNAGKEKEQVL